MENPKPYSFRLIFFFLLLILVLLPAYVHGECTCDADEEDSDNKTKALKLKIGAIASILFFSAIGVFLPLLSKIFPACKPGTDFFFMIKAFAAGVILATGFVHVLPDAFDKLTSSCLKENPWGNFPFTGFIAMMASIGTLMVDTVATGYYKRMHFNKAQPVVSGDEEKTSEEHDGHVHLHTHATHGHAHAHASDESGHAELIRHRVISQVLELGIVVHSVIIGISLGASETPKTIKTLLIALSFHQLFEGMGLGGCISQAKFKNKSIIVMGLFFALTTPVGIGIGIGISSIYNENSSTALIVEGVFNSASAGILIYMALVDLLAADFMSNKVQNSGNLQCLVYINLLVGAGCMSLLAKWA